MDFKFNISNRPKHFFLAIPIGFFLTLLCVIGVASGMEFKDMQYGNKWDWADWVYTILGGIIGQSLLLFWIYLFLI